MSRSKLHDYGGSVDAGPSRSKLHDYGGRIKRLIGADSRTVAIIRVSPGLFKWALYGGVQYPKPTKASYAVGEIVNLDFGYTNTGGTVASATIKVTDNDTGASVWSHTMPSTNAGDTALATGTAIGAMPDKATWNLKCEITP